MMPPTSTVLPLIGRASPLHLGRHSLKQPPVACLVMPLHFLWTHRMHCEQWIELLLTTLEQAAQGYLPDFLMTAWPTPETKNLVYLVFFMLTWSSLLSIPSFHALSLKRHSSWVFVMSFSNRSSVRRSSHGTPMLNSCESASSTGMKSSGLRAESSCTLIPTPNS